MWATNPVTGELTAFPAQIDTDHQQLIPSELEHLTANPPGRLVFQLQADLISTFVVLDLQTGLVSTFNEPDVATDFLNEPVFAPTGLFQAAESHIRGVPVDLVLLDYKDLRRIEITDSILVRELHPAWSPSGKRLAYVAFAVDDTANLKKGEADLYAYDIENHESYRITKTPDIIEAQPTWIGENRIAFIVPASLDPYSTNDRLISEDFGLGVADLATGEYKLVNDHVYNDYRIVKLEYLESSGLLASTEGETSSLYTLSGEEVFKLTSPPRYDCHVLDNTPVLQLCTKYEKEVEVAIRQTSGKLSTLKFIVNPKN